MTDPTKQLADVLNELGTITNATDAPLDELARRFSLVQQSITRLRDISDEITESLAASMEDDQMTIAGVGVFTRKKRTSSSWMTDDSRENMYDDAVRAIIGKVAIDPMTGEVHPPLANAVRQTWNLVTEAFSIGADPKAAFRKSLGLDPSIYRSKYATGYQITIGEETI